MKKYNKIIIVVSVLLLGFCVFYIAGTTIKVPYTDTETYWEKEPYTIQEPYQETETYSLAEWDCDKRYNCHCTHERLWGVLGCDECECTRTVTKYRPVTKYQDVQKTRTITKYQTLFEEWGLQFVFPIIVK